MSSSEAARRVSYEQRNLLGSSHSRLQAGRKNLLDTARRLLTTKTSGAEVAVSFAEGELARRSSAARKKSGSFYTPPQLAREIAEAAIVPLLGYAAPPRLIDPACGSGIFLTTAFSILSAAKRWSAEQILRSIHGIDLDAEALTSAKLALMVCAAEAGTALEAAEEIVDRQLVEGDTLLDECFDPQLRFDAVIGNPPYGLSRGEQISGDDNARLKQRYAAVRSGKVNKYLLFMARGLEMLRPHGRLSFVVPNAWLGIRGGKPLRELLRGSGALERVRLLGSAAFDLGVETATITVEKDGGATELEISSEGEASRLPYALWKKIPDAVLPLNLCAGDEQRLGRLLDAPLRLGDANSPFLPMIALQAYAEGKGSPPQLAAQVAEHAFHCRDGSLPNSIPYLEGRDISRFAVNWSGSYLSHGSWLAEPQTLERFRGPRVLIREILGKGSAVQTAFTDQAFLYNKSVLHVLPKAGTGSEMLLTLCAILNSSVAAFYFSRLGRKAQRKLFPKLVLDDLNDFPLPGDFGAIAARLSCLVRQGAADLDREVARAYRWEAPSA